MTLSRIRYTVGELLSSLPTPLTRLFARAVSGSFLVRAAGAAAVLVLQIVLARLLSADGYGTYQYVWSWVSILAFISTVGFKDGIVRLTSKFRAQEDWSYLYGALRHSTCIVIITSLLIAGILAVASTLVEQPSTSKLYTNLAIGGILVPLLALVHLFQGTLRGLKQVVRADLPHHLIRPLILLPLLGLSCLLLPNVTVTTTIVATAVSIAAAVVAGAYWIFDNLPRTVFESTATYKHWEWLRFAFPFLLISGSSLIQGRADIIILGMLDSSAAVGIYAGATRLTAVIGFGLIATNMIIAPLISELHTKNKSATLQHLIAISSATVFIYTTLVTLLLLLFGHELLALFGPDFEAGYPVLLLVALGQVFSGFAGPVGDLATMTGNQWVATKAFALALVINIALNLILIPSFGVLGAAAATTLSTVSWNGILLVFAIKVLEINPTAIAIRTIL